MHKLATTLAALSFALASAAAVNAEPAAKAAAKPATPPNTLTAKEKASGWRLLFNGKTSKGWRGFNLAKFPEEGWQIKDGLLVKVPPATPGKSFGGDIVTEEEFDSFEVAWEFRLTPGANGGLKYLVDEKLVKDSKNGVSFEFQLLDDDKHPDAKKGKDGNRKCGALYDLIAPKEAAAKPIGEWNEARLVVEGNKVEHWLNGKKVVEFERGSDALKMLIADSKYKAIPGFGEAGKGRLLLQDHFNEVAYRNMKVRKLPGTKTASR